MTGMGEDAARQPQRGYMGADFRNRVNSGRDERKKCAGCRALLMLSDPDVCETCDLHGEGDTDGTD